ncbi:monovalent cation/H(+) antiporter subunit G [Enterococcus hermanniensis]|uniref:Immunity protein n=1 Tax=Enterococcus hermanniensis TaxID=249189 RepID=A0A1L8TSW4_9ENTE|nr:monovalent cation/H(+) antiporter subunit G [Enterococcus hermanniensis]OJG47124.1 hypothetical protein RV04_GL000371 [Enterococcus hermanniensis]
MIIGVIFFLLGVWQLWITKRTYTNLKASGNQETSPFIMISLGSSLIMGVLFLGIAGYSFTQMF